MERQIPYDFIHGGNFNKTKEERGEKRERQTKKQTLNCREQTDGYQRGSRWGKQVMEIKQYTYDECRVMYRIDESLYCTPETNITVYVNYTGIKNLIKKKEMIGSNLSFKRLTLAFILTI